MTDPRRAAAALASTLVLVLVVASGLASCSSDADGTEVAVTGTDDGCTIESERVAAGRLDFVFTNQADDVNELYVLEANGDVVSEVENVTTGTSRTLSVELAAGDYEVRCKPGQTGDGFGAAFVVTGEGGPDRVEPDRTVTFDAVDFDYRRLDLDRVQVGDVIRFEMTNRGDQPHEFEVLGPDGEPLGEVAAMEEGRSGGATIAFEEPGTYTYQCILVDPATGDEHTALGMTGTFEVAAA